MADHEEAVLDRGDDFTPTEDDDELQAVIESTKAPVEEEKKPEVEPEVKAEPEPEAKKEETEAEAKKRVDSRIPLSRHTEILNAERGRREDAERRLAEALKSGATAQVAEDIKKDETQIETLEAQHAKQLADGEIKEATATMRQIRTMERSIIERQVEARSAAATTAAIEQIRYDTVVDRVEAAYPVMNPSDPKFDSAKVAEVLELKQGFQLQNYSASAALQKAVKYVLGAETAAQTTAAEVTPRVDGTEVKEKAADLLDAAGRKEKAVAKAVDADKKLPPSLDKVGIDSNKAGGGIVDGKAVMKMKQDDFNKLGEDELSRLRGDTL